MLLTNRTNKKPYQGEFTQSSYVAHTDCYFFEYLQSVWAIRRYTIFHLYIQLVSQDFELLIFTGHYYDLQPVRRHFNLQVPEPLANSHPHDEAAKVEQHPLYNTYPWRYPKSDNSANPNRKGIDYVFGLQRWSKIP